MAYEEAKQRKPVFWNSTDDVQKGKQVSEIAKQWFSALNIPFSTCREPCGAIICKYVNTKGKFSFRCISCCQDFYYCSQCQQKCSNKYGYRNHIKSGHATNQEEIDAENIAAFNFDYRHFARQNESVPEHFYISLCTYIVDFVEKNQKVSESTDTSIVPSWLPPLLDLSDFESDDEISLEDLDSNSSDDETSENQELWIQNDPSLPPLPMNLTEYEIELSKELGEVEKEVQSLPTNSSQQEISLATCLGLMCSIISSTFKEFEEDFSHDIYLKSQAAARNLQTIKGVKIFDNLFDTNPYENLDELLLHHAMLTNALKKSRYQEIIQIMTPGNSVPLIGEFDDYTIKVIQNELQIKRKNETSWQKIVLLNSYGKQSTSILRLPSSVSKFAKLEQESHPTALKCNRAILLDENSGLHYNSVIRFTVEMLQDPGIGWKFQNRHNQPTYTSDRIFSFTQTQRYDELFTKAVAKNCLPVILGFHFDETNLLQFDKENQRNMFYMFPLNVSVADHRNRKYWKVVSAIDPSAKVDQLEMVKKAIKLELEENNIFVAYFVGTKQMQAFAIEMGLLVGDELCLNSCCSIKSNNAVHFCRRCLILYTKSTSETLETITASTRKRTQQLADSLLHQFETALNPVAKKRWIEAHTSFNIEHYKDNAWRVVRNFSLFRNVTSCSWHIVQLGVFKAKLFNFIETQIETSKEGAFIEFCNKMNSVKFYPPIRSFDMAAYHKFQAVQSDAAAKTMTIFLAEYLQRPVVEIVVYIIAICRCFQNALMSIEWKRVILLHYMNWLKIIHGFETKVSLFNTYPKLHAIIEELLETLLVNFHEYSSITGESKHHQVKLWFKDSAYKGDFYILRKEALVTYIDALIHNHQSKIECKVFDSNYSFEENWVLSEFDHPINWQSIYSLLPLQQFYNGFCLKRIVRDGHEFQLNEYVQYDNMKYGKLVKIICVFDRSTNKKVFAGVQMCIEKHLTDGINRYTNFCFTLSDTIYYVLLDKCRHAQRVQIDQNMFIATFF